MKGFLVFVAFVLVYQPCSSRSLNDEDSVVSVYTTLPTSDGSSPPLDVYRQIAGNIVERITQPIYRFFGFSNTTTTKRPFEHIELDSPDNSSEKNKTAVKNNEIPDRDVEELSVESLNKNADKKPEKFTLFSSLSSAYLPVKENFEFNVTTDPTDANTSVDKTVDTSDNSLELDDVDSDSDDDEQESGREGSFIFFLEFIGSIIQLLWGGFMALFKPSTSSSSS